MPMGLTAYKMTFKCQLCKSSRFNTDYSPKHQKYVCRSCELSPTQKELNKKERRKKVCKNKLKFKPIPKLYFE